MHLKVKYKTINRTHSGYCSGEDASEYDDDHYKLLGECETDVEINDSEYSDYFDSDDDPRLHKFHKRLSCYCEAVDGPGYCVGYGIWKRAYRVEILSDDDMSDNEIR